MAYCKTVMMMFVLCVSLHGSVYAQSAAPPRPDAAVYAHTDDSLAVRIYYPQGVRLYFGHFANNADALSEFLSLYRQKFYGSPVFISASVSPEGSDELNRLLVSRRADALIQQLKDSLDILPDSLYVIDRLTGPRPSSGIDLEEYPSLRYAEAVVCAQTGCLYAAEEAASEPETEPVIEQEPVIAANTGQEAELEPEPESEPEPEPEPAVTPEPSPSYIRRPLFALKTNLLFDAFAAVNAEVEVPVGNRISIAVEWIFPDWVDRRTNRYCLQSNVKSAEVRYWFGDRTIREKLTGHFIGLYGQTGDFDVQPFTEEGFRCFDARAAGLSYGFAHPISRNNSLRLEYSIGIGYVWSECCRYRRALDGEILATKDEWQYGGGLLPVPTKAKVSLVWMIYGKRRVK